MRMWLLLRSVMQFVGRRNACESRGLCKISEYMPRNGIV